MKFVFLVLVSIVTCNDCQQTLKQYAKLTKVYIKTDDIYFSIKNVTLKPINRHLSYINGDGKILKELRNVWV